ncbi:hypothetical protein DMB42_37660 [Nonomuraea sp. WAC 01424]|nr:hypothetical protein DMB42_37660 [Nonomuraea sp. WAC 01424]
MATTDATAAPTATRISRLRLGCGAPCRGPLGGGSDGPPPWGWVCCGGGAGMPGRMAGKGWVLPPEDSRWAGGHTCWSGCTYRPRPATPCPNPGPAGAPCPNAACPAPAACAPLGPPGPPGVPGAPGPLAPPGPGCTPP